MAETLFRQWFVEETEWNGVLSEYIKVQGGYAFKSSDFKEFGNNGIIKITNISMGSIDTKNTQFVDDSIVESLDKSKFKINSGDFLIAMTGAEIGKIGIVEQTNKSLWLNQRVGKIIRIVSFGDLIGYLAVKSIEGQDHILNACSGSAQENISTSGIEEMKFAPYSKEKADSFGKDAKPLFDKIIYNKLQISTLENLRNTLLPKLMSGEVRVSL
jgi:type I restriction enzyme S subunit